MNITEEYIDQDIMKIVYSSLIINVQSINRICGPLKPFLDKNNLKGQTNGKLLILYDIQSPSINLTKIVENQLIPLGFKMKLDFIFAEEIKIQEEDAIYSPYINRAHPNSVGITWLTSNITTDGNFVQYTEAPYPHDIRNDYSFKQDYKPSNTENVFLQKNEASGKNMIRQYKKPLRTIDKIREQARLNPPKPEPKRKPDIEYIAEYQADLIKLDDLELIREYNLVAAREDLNRLESLYRDSFLDEFCRRKIDHYGVGDILSPSFHKKVKLIGKKLFKLE